jgi:hypothetical protein
MSFGKSSGTQTTIPTLSPEQNRMIAAQTGLFTNTIAPSYGQAVTGATDVYNNAVGGVTDAAQNQAATSAQAQNVLGSTGESALKTGISGLESFYDPNYVQSQLNSAMLPAQQQYMQNLANEKAMYGGAGQLGSARDRLASQQLAGTTQAAQQQAAAQILNNIAQQRASVGGTLAQLGQGGLGQAQSAANNQVTASLVPQNLYNQYASVLFGTPSQSWNPNFSGTQGQTVNTQGTKVGAQWLGSSS